MVKRLMGNFTRMPCRTTAHHFIHLHLSAFDHKLACEELTGPSSAGDRHGVVEEHQSLPPVESWSYCNLLIFYNTQAQVQVQRVDVSCCHEVSSSK